MVTFSKKDIGEIGEKIIVRTEEKDFFGKILRNVISNSTANTIHCGGIIEASIEIIKKEVFSSENYAEAVRLFGTDKARRILVRAAKYCWGASGLKMTVYKLYDVKLTGKSCNSQSIKKQGIIMYSPEALKERNRIIAEAIKAGRKNTFNGPDWKDYHEKTHGEHSLPQNVVRDRLLFTENVSEEINECFSHPFVSILKTENDKIRANGYEHKGNGAKERYHFEVVEANTWDEEWKRQEEKSKNGN